jgi:6-phosphogluconate dehydrogenase
MEHQNEAVTLETLAIMVQGGFTQMDARFERIEKRLDDHDAIFVAMNQRFSDIDRRFDTLEWKNAGEMN